MAQTDTATITDPFRPSWWFTNPHVQTIWASSLRRPLQMRLRWEIFSLPDSDEVELAWVDHHTKGPTVVLLHGLTGSVQSNHVMGMLGALTERGFRAGCLHFRGCGRTTNKNPAVGYHSGMTADVAHVLNRIHSRGGPVHAIGFSLGANVLLKLLGEQGAQCKLRSAVAVSSPMVLRHCADRMEEGFSRVYANVLLKKLKRYMRNKRRTVVDPHALERVTTFREFDELVTAPLHGYANAADYYERASCRPFLPSIRTQTLILHAKDDPFFREQVIPHPQELPSCVSLEATAYGGHVGFIEGIGQYYLDRRVPQFIAETATKSPMANPKR